MKEFMDHTSKLMAENCPQENIVIRRSIKRIIMTYMKINMFNIFSISASLAWTKADFLYFHRYFFDSSYFPVRELCFTTSLVGGLCAATVTATIRSSYYGFCVSILTLYLQLYREILKLKYKRNETEAIIRRNVELHIKIVKTIKMLSNHFHELLLWDFVTYIVMIGFILFNSSSIIAFFRMALFMPPIIFGCLISCFGGTYITHEGQQMAVRIYRDIQWHEMDLKHQKSVLIMMTQFQKPHCIKLLGIFVINMEFFTLVSPIN
jgi:7tm Odorant receptor